MKKLLTIIAIVSIFTACNSEDYNQTPCKMTTEEVQQVKDDYENGKITKEEYDRIVADNPKCF